MDGKAGMAPELLKYTKDMYGTFDTKNTSILWIWIIPNSQDSCPAADGL
jgi:hypothetical protein